MDTLDDSAAAKNAKLPALQFLSTGFAGWSATNQPTLECGSSTSHTSSSYRKGRGHNTLKGHSQELSRKRRPYVYSMIKRDFGKLHITSFCFISTHDKLTVLPPVPLW
jgi:hypothetical protein